MPSPEVLFRQIEVPVVLAFIIFAIAMFKYFQKWSDSKDKIHKEHLEKSESNWRKFLEDQRDSFLKSISDITCAVSEMREKQEEHSRLLAEHDKKLDVAIARMDGKSNKE